MRVVDVNTSRNYLNYLNSAKSSFADDLEAISSGNRFNAMSDDVSAATKVMNLRMDLSSAETQLNNIAAVSDTLVLAENSMDAVSELLTRVNELGIKAANDPQGDAGRAAIAQELAALADEFIIYANSKTSGGQFIFGGINASINPAFSVDPATGEALYNGVNVNDIQKKADGSYFYMDNTTTPPSEVSIPLEDTIHADIGIGLEMIGSNVTDDSAFLASFSGLDAFGFGVDPTTGISNNIYNAIKDLQASVESDDQELMGTATTQISTMADEFRATLADMGAKVNFLENMETRLEGNVDQYKIRIDDLMGTNDEEAVQALALSEYVLEAIQALGSRTLPNSLMSFLR